MPTLRNTHTFTVKLDEWSAVIETHSNHTLYDLAETILDAVHFDMDHAFGFYEPDYFKPKRSRFLDRNSFEQYTLFADMDGMEVASDDPGVKTVSVAEIFDVGLPFVFLYDYGDDWRFDIVCTSITMGTKLKKKTAVLSTKGRSPEQYRPYNEEK